MRLRISTHVYSYIASNSEVSLHVYRYKQVRIYIFLKEGCSYQRTVKVIYCERGPIAIIFYYIYYLYIVPIQLDTRNQRWSNFFNPSEKALWRSLFYLKLVLSILILNFRNKTKSHGPNLNNTLNGTKLRSLVRLISSWRQRRYGQMHCFG